jgi:hypothetical protein
MPQIAVLAVVILAIPGTAAAYIDPNAGSIVLQLVLGGIAGLGVIVRLYYRRLVGLFRRGKDESATAEHEGTGGVR